MNPFSSNRRRSRSRSGRDRRTSLLILAVAAVVGAFIFGPALASTTAFSTLTAERGSNVAVVDDSDAYLALDAESSIQENQRTVLATVTNNLGEVATITVSLTDPTAGNIYAIGDTSFGDHRIEVVLDPGESVDVDLNASTTGDLSYVVTGSTQGTSVNLQRTVSVEEAPDTQVDICHQTNSPKNPWVSITVDQSSVPAHIDHGDFVIDKEHPCPPDSSDDKDGEEDAEGDGDNTGDEESEDHGEDCEDEDDDHGHGNNRRDDCSNPGNDDDDEGDSNSGDGDDDGCEDDEDDSDDESDEDGDNCEEDGDDDESEGDDDCEDDEDDSDDGNDGDGDDCEEDGDD